MRSSTRFGPSRICSHQRQFAEFEIEARSGPGTHRLPMESAPSTKRCAELGCHSTFASCPSLVGLYDFVTCGAGSITRVRDVCLHARLNDCRFRKSRGSSPTESVLSSGDAAARYSTRPNCDVFASPATWSRKMRMRSVLRRSGCVRIQRSVAIDGMTPPTRLNCSSFSPR